MKPEDKEQCSEDQDLLVVTSEIFGREGWSADARKECDCGSDECDCQDCD